MTRPAETLAALVDQLVVEVRHTELVDYWPTREGLHALHANGLHPGDPATTRIGKPQPRRHTTRQPGLLTQLATCQPTTLDPDVHTRTTPHSQPPPGATAAETLTDIQAAATAWRTRAHHTIGRPTPHPTTTHRTLRDLVGLIGMLTPTDAQQLINDTRTWIRTARTTLGWDPPTLTLGHPCPNCGHMTLRMAADGTTGVWCTTRVHGPNREGEPWPLRCAHWHPAEWRDILTALATQETP